MLKSRFMFCTGELKQDHINCTCDVIDFIAYLETENPLPEAIFSFCASVLVLIRLYVPVKTF